MRDLCLDEGILQSYFDGQLAPEVIEQVVTHVASCPLCTDAARQVEIEMNIATEAFASELALSVPSERLRTRLDQAILDFNAQTLSDKEPTASGFRGWLGSIASGFNFTPQRALGFASLMIFFVLAAVLGGIVMRQRARQTGLEIIAGNRDEPGDLTFRGVEIVTPPSNKDNLTRLRSTHGIVRPRAGGPAGDSEIHTEHRMLPGERNYLRAISLLTDAIEANGETSLKPTLLSDYKRNLAVVDQAISATQRTARTNPNSSDAAEMLYAVYQSKLDLLSAIAEQSQPMIAQR